jgi:uncharacterized protein
MTEQTLENQQPKDNGKPYLPVWGPWQTTWLGLAIFGINAGAQAGVLIALAAREFARNPGLGLLPIIGGLASNGLAVSLALIVSATVGVAMVIVFVRARKRASIREYLDLKPITRRQALINLAIVSGVIALIELVGRATGQSTDTFTMDVYRTADPVALLWVAFVVFAPAFEETFFRGFLFAGWVRSRLGPVGTILLTSALFAALHIQYNLFGILSVFAVAIALGIRRLKTGSLWSPLLMHFAWNLWGTIAISLELRGIGS